MTNLLSARLARRAWLKGALALALAPALAACLPRTGPAGTLRVGLPAEPATLDPLLQTGLLEASVYGNLFDGLLAHDADGKPVPALAEAYRALDERRWELRLRRGVRFHNDEPFDAASVRATVERMLDPATKSPIRAQLAAIERVETPSAYTVVFVTRQPFAPLLAELTGLMMLPPRYLTERGPDALAERPIGTGPFRFVEWRRDDQLVLEAFEGHWRGPARARRLDFRPVPETASRLAALRAGQLDLATNVPYDQAALLESEGQRVVGRPGVQTLYLRLHARKPPLDDLRVRRALALAVDADRLIQAVYGGRARRVNGPFPPEVFAYDDSAPLSPYDPEQARRLLREAGHGDGLRLSFQTPRGRYPGDDQVPLVLAGFFAEVGVRAEIEQVEWGAYLSRLQAGQGGHLFLLAGTNRTFDPHFTISRIYGNASPFGQHYLGDEQIDVLADQAAATLDSARRRELYATILARLRQSVPAIWLAQLDDLYALQPGLTWQPRADSLLWLHRAQPAPTSSS